MDIQKIFDDLIKKYGKNEGYELPVIEWSKENMFARYGEYQYWCNRIVISRLLDTDKVSEKAVAHVIYHEYLHQIYRDHEQSFEEKMRKFADSATIQKYMKEIEDYFACIKDFPVAPRHENMMCQRIQISLIKNGLKSGFGSFRKR